ncbi:MAG: STAS domain-containing protein [Chitinispirillaceae bacterium]|nr:STAS domain-containing protein [Chitinispirillaceae bacterium]
MSLELSEHLTENTAVLRVVGTINQMEVYRFSRALRDIEQHGHPYIAVDISKVEYLESHALGILVSHFLALQKQGRELVFFASNDASTNYMVKVLESTRLNEMIRIITPSQPT